MIEHIGVDLDDVVVDFIPGVLASANKEFGTSLTVDDITEWDLHPLLDPICGRSWWSWMRENERLWANFEAVRGAIGGLDKLHREGRYLECAVPGSRVLTGDLCWVPIESLSPGDLLLAFDEGEGRSKMVMSTVEDTSRLLRPTIEVVTDKGTTTVSMNHQFLVRVARPDRGTFSHKRWLHAGELRVGMSIVGMGTWDQETTWEAGYLAGQLDGEGWINTNKRGGVSRVVYSQKNGAEMDLVERLLNERGFDTVRHAWRRENPNHLPGGNLNIKGDGATMLRLLGQIRPNRFLSRVEDVIVGRSTKVFPSAVVQKITFSEKPQEVVAVQTTSRTLIVDGLFSHNCVTSKPDWARHNVYIWLGKWRPWFDKVTIVSLGDKKVQFTDAELLIDDKPENCLEFVRAGRKAILFGSAHNRGMTIPGVQRVENWAEVPAAIAALEG